MVYKRSLSVTACAIESGVTLHKEVYSHCFKRIYTSVGYNHSFGHRHLKRYSEAVSMCAKIIREATRARLIPMIHMNIVSDKQKRMRVVHTMLRVENIFTFFIERSIVGMKGNA